MAEVKIKIRNKKPLTGTGYTWEYLLMCEGWNDLPEEKKFGLADENLIVRFPHCNNISFPMFEDEIIRPDKKGKHKNKEEVQISLSERGKHWLSKIGLWFHMEDFDFSKPEVS